MQARKQAEIRNWKLEIRKRDTTAKVAMTLEEAMVEGAGGKGKLEGRRQKLESGKHRE
jgi:hypothetical protein